MTAPTVSVERLLVGMPKPFGERQVLSGIEKTDATGPLWLSPTGLTGDGQGDLRVHGGPDKALHHYPFEHYAAWRGEIGDNVRLRQAGAFGENISTSGLDEDDVAVGDIFRVGSALIEVSQGRQPCWKLNHRFGVRDMARRVQASGRTGWYYRVLEPGRIATGDAMKRVDRRSPEWTIKRLWHILYVDTLDREQLAAMAAVPHLPQNWRRYAERRLQTGAVEDWTRRLAGEDA